MGRKRKYQRYKEPAIALRRTGKTYTQIQEHFDVKIPPSTLSTWFQDANFSSKEIEIIVTNGKNRIRNGHQKSLVTKQIAREKRFQEIRNRLAPLVNELENKDIAKIVLITLYWCEGSKNRKGELSFGNSDPRIIKLFLKSLRGCYAVDESKLRCTLQCRADQNIQELEKYWSKITGVPLSQFYKAKVDKRTIGKPSKKLDYKGVCRIDYFSAVVYHELIVAESLF